MPLIELDAKLIVNKQLRTPVGISGAAAIARGIIESGVRVVTGYPGSPCSEIIENITLSAKSFDINAEWSINEKVAFEIAASAAMAGTRAAFITKSAGMNWASDPLITMSYAGINAGMVVISGDDPGALNSSTEEDTRYYSKMSKIMCMEPSDQQEAKDMVVEAYSLSEKINLPVLIHTTNRILYGRSKVFLGDIIKLTNNTKFKKEMNRWFVAGSIAANRHKWLIRQQRQLKIASNESRFNKASLSPCAEYGVVTTGVSFFYVKEVLSKMGLEGRVSLLKIASINPLPLKVIKEFLSRHKTILVLEELAPLIESGLKIIISENPKHAGIRVYGKLSGDMPENGYYNPDMVSSFIEKKLAARLPRVADKDEVRSKLKEFNNTILPYKQHILCPGCPHRASFYALSRAMEKTSEDFIIATDTGCYALGAFFPFFKGDLLFNMGSSISVAAGFGLSKYGKRAIAVIGDGTFMHNGLQALINCVSKDMDILAFVLDNNTLAITGLQSPVAISIEELSKAAGAKHVEVCDPFNTDMMQQKIEDALKARGPRVVIARHKCAQLTRKRAGQNGTKPGAYKIDERKCGNCRLCIDSLACPAIYLKDNKVHINESLCSACGLCTAICPKSAIIKL